jgi:hypothetical protein
MQQATGKELAELLAPVSPAVFRAEYWGRKPLFIKGTTERLARLLPGGFDRAAFCHTVSESAGGNSPQFRLHGGSSARGSVLPTPEEPVRPLYTIPTGSLEATMAEGDSVIGVNLAHRELLTLALALKAQLQHAGPVGVRATLSPPGAKIGAHFDKTSAIFIHCEGRKWFYISKGPVIDWPRDDAELLADGSAEYNKISPEDWEEVGHIDLSGCTEFVMEPGDVLYLPAGTIHATKALDEHTVGINLHFDHLNLLDLVDRILRNRLQRDPAWRHLPEVTEDGGVPGQLPVAVERFFAERLTELREAVSTLTADGLDLNREWHRLIADPGAANAAVLALTANAPGDRPIRRQDRLRVTGKVPVTVALGEENGEASLYLYWGDKEVSVSGEWVPFLQNLSQQECFVAETATTWSGGTPYPWETIREYLQALRDQGLLEQTED